MTHLGFLDLCCVMGLLFFVSHVWFFVRVLRPIHQLSLQAALLSKGDLDSFNCQCRGIPEIGVLHRAMSSIVAHVRRAQEQNQAYTDGLAEIQENERKRIARELHDDAVQATIAVTQSIDMAKNWVKTDPDRAIQMLQLVREQAVEIVTHLRNLIGNLRPPALEELGLIPALQMQFNLIQAIPITFKTHGEPRRLEELQELALFRAVQEALRNAIRHSHAKQITVNLYYDIHDVSLSVQDDGNGFDVPPTLGELALQHHFGLLGIQERAKSLGGRIRVDSQLGKGTEVHICLSTTSNALTNSWVYDPVCNAYLDPTQAYGHILYHQQTYYFCCPVCQGAFQNAPQLYLNKTKQGGI